MTQLKPGMIIEGPFWPEFVEIRQIEELGDYYQISGLTKNTHQHVDQLLSQSDMAKIRVIGVDRLFAEDAWKVFLALETIRFRYASLYDPLLAMNTSKIDPLPHQIEAVYGYVLQLPRIRFLIADDPGAGKTIMAGLIIKELKIRHMAKRILIVAPGHLKDQWQREMRERFSENFVVVDRGFVDGFYGENVWARENQLVTSIDFAKRDEVLPAISAARFDLIIVDEAHKMSAYRYGDKIDRTSRYKLGEVLSKSTEHLLFLTATPHRGDQENFRLFLDLLVPGFFATKQQLEKSAQDKDNPLFIRRVKEDLKDFEGKPLFLPRHVTTKAFNLRSESPTEQDLYNDLSKYVVEQYNKALTRDKKRNVAFALVILQRRLASSTYAVLKSLERRKKRLEDMLEGASQFEKPGFDADVDATDDMNEEERWKEEELWETLSVAENREELKKEVTIIESLIQKAKSIIHNEEEIKLKHFRDALKSLHERVTDPKERKILVFTESKDTLEYLEKKVNEWGYRINTIHGSMKLDERVKAESVFKNETDVMIATEAAGEGINLQFCHLMINYDLPWNPNRLEQRMGRIHRYGQTKEVQIVNLVAEDTREGAVMCRLFQKLDEIRQAMGNDKVFDMIGNILYEKNLSQLLVEAAANARSMDEILKDMNIVVDEEYISKIKISLDESLATHFIDYTRIADMAQKAREYRLIPEYTEAFFIKAFSRAGGKFRLLKNGFIVIDSIPLVIRQITGNFNFIKTYGKLDKYNRITFDKEVAFKNPDAEFVTFGHPLFEAVMRWIETTFAETVLNGATFIDPDGRMDGYLLYYEAEIKDGANTIAGKRLFTLYATATEVIPVFPAIIWDLQEATSPQIETLDLEALKKQTFAKVIPILEAYKGELLKERQRQAGIKEKYGITSLNHLIYELEEDLIKLNERKLQGEAIDLPIRNKEEQKARYLYALESLKKQIEQEKNLAMTRPRFVGALRVVPNTTTDAEMTESVEIEHIGMAEAMRYEREQGREPEDVSAENLGFDIRSREKNGVTRYIEVKARAATGAVILTQNEWFKAKRFQRDYYLYAVLNAATTPQLYLVQNPAHSLKPQEIAESVRYLIPYQEILNNRLA